MTRWMKMILRNQRWLSNLDYCRCFKTFIGTLGIEEEEREAIEVHITLAL